MPVEEIQTKSLDEFWDILSPIGKFVEHMQNPIFRGQGDTDWLLTPAVLRKEIKSKYKNESSACTQIDQIVFFEYFMLLNFLSYADQMGFIIPNDSPDFRTAMSFSVFTDRYGIDGDGWPSKEYFPFIALAQHHGIPTRFLDWTRSPLVAAYFSASQVLGLEEQPKSLSVWAVDAEALKSLEGKLDCVVLPGSTSNNLAAQKGVFLVHRQQGGMTRNDLFLAENLKNSVDKIFEESHAVTAYKITLPANLTGDLIHRCNKFGVSAAALFPGFDGVARATLEFEMAKKLSGLL